MPIRLDDKHCLLWIKDPSISPFENNYTQRKYRKDILSDEALKNPKSFLNKIKRKCFYKSALRPKIIEQIKEYQSIGPIRLHTLNDKITETDEYKYTIKPFTKKECERWTRKHLINPRTNIKITMGSGIYIELIYSAIQNESPLPSILINEPTHDILPVERALIINMNKIIINVKRRFEFMKQNDKYFLNHDVGSFDKKLKIASSLTPRYKSAKANNSFNVSTSSSYKSLNSEERRQLRDIELEGKEEKSLVAEYQHKNRQTQKKSIDKTIFAALREVIDDIHSNRKKIIDNILEDASLGAKARLKVGINSFVNRRGHDVQNILESYNLDKAEGIIDNFINNIFAQLIEPSFLLPKNLEITCFSYTNKITYFKNAELISKIEKELYDYIDDNYAFQSDDKILRYFRSIIVDVIPKEFVAKREIEVRTITGDRLSISNYQNNYYKLLLSASEEPKRIRLPNGRGLLIGNELTNAIYELEVPYFNTYPEDRVITDDNPLNGFTYEECKNWVTMPIINPRTFKRILIDSPIYNRLLCISYQYDTELIPRMITSRGYKIIEALTDVIDNILKDEGKLPQSREQLEKYIISKEEQYAKKKKKNELISNNVIGLKWKSVGIKKPNVGIEIVNKKLNEAFLKSTGRGKDVELPFYVLFSEIDFAKFGVTDITKNSYIEISTYYIQVIDNKNKNANNLGLKWKMINNERYKEGIKRGGVQIINKKLKEAILKLASKGNILPAHVSFSKEDLENFGITTTVPKNRYIKFTFYYVPVVERSASNSFTKPKSNSNVAITKRNIQYTVYNYKYYTIADCLRWAHQPNRDPIRPEIIIQTDSVEYNTIFEQALVYDYNIQPINITPKGIKFKKLIFKTKNEFLTIAKYSKLSTSRGADIKEINSKVCNAIKNIYDDETNDIGKKYKIFKDKMIKKCEQYNKEPSKCIEYIKERIEDYFQSEVNHTRQYTINYYQDSALASLLIEYDNKKGKIYNEGLRDIFIHDFNKFYIHIYELDEELNEIRKDAIDAGGPKREFFTKLFEELFCDENHLTRPFISPKNIIGYKYYINPNFAPDEKFRKVIQAYTQNNDSNIIQFNKERDYEYIYYIIGKLLCLVVYNEEIGLSNQFSAYILEGFIKQPNELDYYDMLYFYLREFDNTIPYINMVSNSQINNLEYAELSFNDLYIVSKAKRGSQNSDGEKIIKDNCIKFILQQSKHVVTKNFLDKEEVNSGKSMKKRYDSLFAGFSNEMRKFLYREKVTIEQLSLLITNEPLTEAILQELARKIVVKIEVSYLPESDPNYDPNNKMSNDEKKEREDDMKGYIANIITQPREGVLLKDHYEFIKNLLRFWTGLNYYNKAAQYRIFYKYGWNINVKNLPGASTCFNQLYIYGFPADTEDVKYTPEMKIKYIYDKIILAVGEQEMELQ